MTKGSWARLVLPGSNGTSIFDTIDAQSLPRDTNGSTVTLGGGDEDDVDVPPFMRR